MGTYLGNNRCDDLDELETCPDCNGRGLSEICDYCREMEEEAEIEEEERERRRCEFS
jgi:hypothetical protein